MLPKTLTQLCIVHLVRASLRYVNAKDTQAVVAALKRIYQSATVDEAQAELIEKVGYTVWLTDSQDMAGTN